MSISWSKDIEVITLFVEDLPKSKLFYEKVFDLSVVFEDDNCTIFDFGNLIINLLKISESHQLISPMVVSERKAGSRFMFTIKVKDVDAVCKDLDNRGVELLNGPIDRPWGRRTACFADPDGHCWEIAQEL